MRAGWRPHLDPGNPAIRQLQAGHGGVQPDRYLLGQQAGPQARRQGLPEAEHRLPEQAGARRPAEDLRTGEDGPGVAGAQAQPAVVGLGDGDAVRCRCVGGVEVGQLGPQHPPVQRYRLDAAPLGQPAGRLGIVVGVARYPGEVDRGAGAHEGEHGRAVLQQRPLPLRRDLTARHEGQVGAGLFGGVPDAGPAQDLVARQPEPAAGAGRGAAEPAGLLDHHHPQAVVRRGERGGHPGGAAAHHHDVELGLRG